MVLVHDAAAGVWRSDNIEDLTSLRVNNFLK